MSKIIQLFFALSALAIATEATAQTSENTTAPKLLSGQVSESLQNGETAPVVGANIYWKDTTIGTVSDSSGRFELKKVPETNDLVVSFIGFQNDTISVHPDEEELMIQLAGNALNMAAIEVKGKRQSTYISALDPLRVETITADELCKAACCNLSESFETNATVDVGYSDGVSGAKEIRMLGLDGVYTQILAENMPAVRGLATTYGLGYIPGIWIHSIQVTKGAGSVVNGYESIAGQINVELQKPESSERLYLNLFGNMMGRAEATLNLAHRFKNPKWSGGLLLHGNFFNNKVDHNKDGFVDMPLIKNANAVNRWKYDGRRLKAQFGVKALVEDRTGGQTSFQKSGERTPENPYGINISTKRAEFFSKTGFIFKNPKKSVGIMLSGTHHSQSSYFGTKDYEGVQNSLYANAIFQTETPNEKHLLKTGASFVFDDYGEVYENEGFARRELIPGTFAEYTYKNSKNLSLVAGLRIDHHNLYGLQISPRLHLKYLPTPTTTLRASGGSGFRTANVFAENMGIFASARSLHMLEGLKPEKAWNYGISLVQSFELGGKAGSLVVDAYRTDFTNQVIADVYSTDDRIEFYNLKGKSFANSLQLELKYEPARNLNIKIAYKLDDARTTYGGKLIRLPLQSTHKGLLNLAYETRNERWLFDGTTQLNGKKHLFNPLLGNDANTLVAKSPIYALVNAQVTYRFKKFAEIYVGGENMGNYRQKKPIVSAENPFGNEFDATNIWAPIFGNMYYVGLRFRIQ